MVIFSTRESLTQYIQSETEKSSEIGFVPTMGSLHDGHLSLISQAKSENDFVIVSIFVNPTQFDNPSDFDNYPRDINRDILNIEKIAPEAIIYTPISEDIYNDSVVSKTFDLKGLDKVMEGKYRDGHFDGVATVVSFFLNFIRPNRAYFGEKDFQQLQIIRLIAKQLKFPIQITACPIYREPNGLAMSSRNERLSASTRKEAGVIYKELSRAKELLKTTSIAKVKTTLKEALNKNNKFDIQYIEVAEEETLSPTEHLQKGHNYRLFIAVFVEDIRLIDNIALTYQF